jgi:hypothetical protein
LRFCSIQLKSPHISPLQIPAGADLSISLRPAEPGLPEFAFAASTSLRALQHFLARDKVAAVVDAEFERVFVRRIATMFSGRGVIPHRR